jgi:hypothetical protein
MSTTIQVIIGFGIMVESSDLIDWDNFDIDWDRFNRYYEDGYHYFLIRSTVIDQDSDCITFDPEKLKCKQSELLEFYDICRQYKLIAQNDVPKWYAFRWSY